MKLSIIMPVYNEKMTLSKIVERVMAVDLDKELIIIDDCSTDGTRELFKQYQKDTNIEVILQTNNQGKGAAIRAGIKKATGDYIIIQDADLEYDPNDYLKLINPIIEKKTDVVYGSRFLGDHKFSSITHFWGNKLLTLLTSALYGAKLTDMETCYKLIPAKFMKGLKLNANRFDFEPEITAKILKQGLRIVEVPISYKGREFSEGKKISWKDGFAAIGTLLKYRFYD
ncbi:MAG: glycosyltransferase family 2 protein [Candidatus Saganbacteria bacterium]|nr:glycosyltransferase family 2 protein [Candidatus Saganbacteria bacterium]